VGNRVLVLNAGSSSLKASVIDGEAIDAVARADVSGAIAAGGEEAAVRRAIETLAAQGVETDSVEAVGHRVVHGGARFVRPTVVDDAVLHAIEDLAPLAPLHNPIAARVIGAARSAIAGRPHVAVFDTAFHATLAPEAFVYALPHEWYRDWGYRRYGFHGISVRWALERAAQLLGTHRADIGLVVAHLGAGCSVTAVSGGESVYTSMGMTPLEGLVMATRAGSVDPGVLVAAQRDHGLDVDALAETLERRSGLLGVSGRSGDVRVLIAAEPTDERAALALALVVRSVAAGIAAAATALTRLDAVVFTGGIGEHSGELRARIARRLGPLGIPELPTSSPDYDAVLVRGTVSVLRVAAREDFIVARDVRDALAAPGCG
jgi:acetate kinase